MKSSGAELEDVRTTRSGPSALFGTETAKARVVILVTPNDGNLRAVKRAMLTVYGLMGYEKGLEHEQIRELLDQGAKYCAPETLEHRTADASSGLRR